jgi:long-chain acyl-CoA synthetase
LSAVALYDTFGESAIEYIINHAELPLIVTAPAGLGKLLAVAPKCPTLKTIVVIGSIPEDASSDAVKLLTFEDLEKLGAENDYEDVPPKPETLAVIMYTSGTTGMPKGVLHRHSNLVCTMVSACLAMGGLFTTDVHLSYLPLAHIFERMVEIGVICHGGKIGFFQGDIKKLRDDISMLKPTIFAGVPKVYDRFKSAIDDKLAQTNFFVKFFVDYGFSSRMQEISEGKTPAAWSLIFNSFREQFGGNLRLLVSGGAPLSPEVRDFLRVCFGCPFIQGYGLTETSAAGTVMLQNDHFTSNHIGSPVPSVEIKLMDIPEMNYLSTNDPPQGEICIKGPSISSGYYKDPEKTAADFEESGWYHTGDVGEWRKNGALAIIDRKKNIFKLAQGEYIAAESIELKLANSRWVSQFWIYGDSLKDSVVAIITLDQLFLNDYIKNTEGCNIDYNKISEEELNEDKDLVTAVEKDILAVAKAAKLAGFETPRAIYLAKEWLPESDLVTPTMKLKRPQLKKYYAEVIENLYKVVAERAAARAAGASSSSK